MFTMFKPKQTYLTLSEKDPEGNIMLGTDYENESPQVNIKLTTRSSFTLAFLMTLSIVSTWLVFFGSIFHQQAQPSTTTTTTIISAAAPSQHGQTCQTPAVRREWRTLSDAEKLEYISAVQCLSTKPSILHDIGTMHDDYPWVHKHLAPKTHVAASFLPWHRQYIHQYETTLKEQCGFKGSLPYWDWSLDWESPDKAPVWDPIVGLGGNGDNNGDETVGNGRCVTDGPFAGLEAKYYDDQYQPHCLSRGFAPDLELRELGALIQPSAIASMMNEDNYSAFEEDLEHRAHRFLSHSVRGDLSKFTGPNDPVFFLHHANIDRVWWEWQQVDPANRLYAYDGRASNITDKAANLADVMEMAGLMADLPVARVMETVNGELCYGY